MATNRKRTNRWQVQVRRQGLRSINKSFHTYKAAHTWARLMEAQADTRNPLLVPVILFALVTGMRRGEIVAMRWIDIDRPSLALLIPTTKTGHARTIPLIPEAFAILDRLPQTEDRVFPMTANGLRLTWERLRKRAGLTDLNFHDLRHEAISRFFEAGLSTPEVALISGHRDARMLFRYTHPMRAQIISKLANQQFISLPAPAS